MTMTRSPHPQRPDTQARPAVIPSACALLGLALTAQPALAQKLPTATALESFSGHATVVGVTLLAVVIAIVLHYEALGLLTVLLARIRLPPRPRILLLIFAVLGAHIVEIWVFGAGFYLLTSGTGHGALMSDHPIAFLDDIYFSAVCFTTLGLGDIVPVGAIRFLTGTEALTGFVLITWSASFAFLEMQRFWRR